MKAPVSLNKMRWLLRLMGWFKIPMIAYVAPRLMKLDDESVAVRIKLRRRTKNHLNSMYFGALAVGADIAAGIHAFYFAEQFGGKVSFAFKSVNAHFLQRATTHILFISEDGEVVRKAIEESHQTGERVNKFVKVIALNTNEEPVATFDMEISVKMK